MISAPAISKMVLPSVQELLDRTEPGPYRIVMTLFFLGVQTVDIQFARSVPALNICLDGRMFEMFRSFVRAPDRLMPSGMFKYTPCA